MYKGNPKESYSDVLLWLLLIPMGISSMDATQELIKQVSVDTREFLKKVPSPFPLHKNVTLLKALKWLPGLKCHLH